MGIVAECLQLKWQPSLPAKPVDTSCPFDFTLVLGFGSSWGTKRKFPAQQCAGAGSASKSLVRGWGFRVQGLDGLGHRGGAFHSPRRQMLEICAASHSKRHGSGAEEESHPSQAQAVWQWHVCLHFASAEDASRELSGALAHGVEGHALATKDTLEFEALLLFGASRLRQRRPSAVSKLMNPRTRPGSSETSSFP